MNRSDFAAPRCPGSLKEGFDTYCPAIRKSVFQGKQVFHVLDVDESAVEWNNIRVQAGTQSWYRLRLDKNKLTPDPHGFYLLKTNGPGETDLRYPMDQAGNEHLCLAIAEQLFGFEIVSNALIFFPDGKPAIIYRYLPLASTFQSFKVLQEQAGISSRKKISFMTQAELLDQYGAASLVLRDWYFQLTLYLWLIANGEGHAKYGGVVKTKRGDFAPAPLFGIYSGPVHQLTPELCLAGGLFEGDSQSPGFREHGHYTRTEFEMFGERLKLPESRIIKTINRFASLRQDVLLLINRAFIPEEAKQIFRYNFLERVDRLL